MNQNYNTSKQYEDYLLDVLQEDKSIDTKQDLLELQSRFSDFDVQLAFSDEDHSETLKHLDDKTDELLKEHLQNSASSLFVSGRNEVVVSPSAKSSGEYQITFFDEYAALSDNQRETIEDVVRELKMSHCIPLRKEFSEFAIEHENERSNDMTSDLNAQEPTIVNFHFKDDESRSETTIESSIYDLSKEFDRNLLEKDFNNAINYILDKQSSFVYDDFPLDAKNLEVDFKQYRDDYDEDEIEEMENRIAHAKENDIILQNIEEAIRNGDVSDIEEALWKLDITGYSFEITDVDTVYDKLIEKGYPVSSSNVSNSLYTVNDLGEEVRISDHYRPNYGDFGDFEHEYTNQLIIGKDKKVTQTDLESVGIYHVGDNNYDSFYLGNNGEDVHEINQDLLNRIKENHDLDGNETLEELEDLELDSMVIDVLEKEPLEKYPIIRLDDELEL